MVLICPWCLSISLLSPYGLIFKSLHYHREVSKHVSTTFLSLTLTRTHRDDLKCNLRLFLLGGTCLPSSGVLSYPNPVPDAENRAEGALQEQYDWSFFQNIHTKSYKIQLFPSCAVISVFPRFWSAAAQFGGCPDPLSVRPGSHPCHYSHVALQPDHAHAAWAPPHPALLSGGHRGPDGLVQRELARGGERIYVLKRVFLYSRSEWLPLKAHQPLAQVKHDMNAFSVWVAYVF